MPMPMPIDLPDATLPLHDRAATRALEAAAAQGLPPHSLMARAGFAVARLALAIAPHARTMWVAAGAGNNGGDGLEAAAHLQAAGRRVIVTLLGDEQHLPADAQQSLHRARAAGVCFADAPAAADLVIDALLGIGGGLRPLSAPIGALVEYINAQTTPVLAVDLPSGLNGDTGTVHDRAVRATHTVSLLTVKPGLYTAQGRDRSGMLWFDNLQCSHSTATATALLLGQDVCAPWRLPRPHASHKGRFGDSLVVGGAAGMVGAAVLAARAALAAGAGRVWVHGLDPHAPTLDLGAPALMWRRALDHGQLAHATVVAGCGGGESIAAVLPTLLSRAARLVLDADALNAVATDASLRALLRARRAPTVITPHPLEAARLLEHADASQVQSDRLRAATELAAQLRCTVVLKGSGSVIATPGQAPGINPSGNARLATAGTGDVLAGWLGGRWSARADASADSVARCAVYEHGLAAQAAPLRPSAPLVASDLITALAELQPVSGAFRAT